MSQPLPLAIPKLRALVREAESASDAALIAKLDLPRGILHTRQTERMPAPHTGQAGIMRLTRAIQSDLSAQNDLFRTHDAMTRASHEIWPGSVTADYPHDTPTFGNPDEESAAA